MSSLAAPASMRGSLGVSRLLAIQCLDWPVLEAIRRWTFRTTRRGRSKVKSKVADDACSRSACRARSESRGIELGHVWYSRAAPQKLTAISKLRHEQQELEFPDLDLQPLPSGGQGYRRSQEKQSRHARPKTKDVAAKIEKALDRHERCAVRHHRRCHTWLQFTKKQNSAGDGG